MRVRHRTLLNSARLEAVPTWLAHARSNDVARRLAASDWLIRLKSGGRFLAVRRGDVLQALQRGALPRTFDTDLQELAANAGRDVQSRPLGSLGAQLAELGLDPDYPSRTMLDPVPEPTALAHAGFDRYRRALWLTDATSASWRRMQHAARCDGTVLEAISGYRSHDYQFGIFRRKLARGQTLPQILQVNAAPGYSEHHSGEALDLGTPGEPAAEASFESTPAFAWLQRHASSFGFSLSFPRGNPHGIVYEPWHWRWSAHATSR